MLPAAPPDAPRWRLIVLLVVAGVALRLLHDKEFGSDVLLVTRSAITYVAMGENPYGHGYLDSRPPGAPFAYGPMALLWYAVLPRNVELLASVAVLLLLAVTRRVIGLAICALWVPLAILANDGSNDSSAGLLLLGALVLAERSPSLGAAALGVVVAFKPYALAFLPPLIAFGGPVVLLPFLATSAALWGPAIALWGAGNIVTSMRMAMDAHVLAWSSPAAVLQLDARSKGLLTLVQLGLGLLTAAVSLRFARSARAMVAWGIVIFAATLFTGWWATVAYWAAVVPIGAWHADAWYREHGRRVAWPAGNSSWRDPV